MVKRRTKGPGRLPKAQAIQLLIRKAAQLWQRIQAGGDDGSQTRNSLHLWLSIRERLEKSLLLLEKAVLRALAKRGLSP
jgi:hypothetical protein